MPDLEHSPLLPTPRLITPYEAAELLKVSPRVVQDWLASGRVPYLELPTGSGTRREYRIPLQPLLICVPDLYDLVGELMDMAVATENWRLTEARLVEALNRAEP